MNISSLQNQVGATAFCEIYLVLSVFQIQLLPFVGRLFCNTYYTKSQLFEEFWSMHSNKKALIYISFKVFYEVNSDITGNHSNSCDI